MSLFIYSSLFSQGVAINNTNIPPVTSSMLDVSATDKGVLIPRLALTQTTLSNPITSPATSLLVYNTASINDVTPGYYYWNGSIWIRFANGNGGVNCNTTNYIIKSDGFNGTCSQIFDNGTNVGIATTTPQGKLHISNAYNVTGASARPNHIFLEEPNNSNLKGYIGLNLNTAAGANLEYLGIEAVEDGIHWANIILAEQGGNVGIGTSLPSTKLEVNGSIYANNGGVRSSISNTWANHDIFVAAIDNHPAFVGLRARGTIAIPSYPLSNDVLLTLTGRDIIDGYNGYGGNLNAFGGASIDFRAVENFSGTNKGTAIIFNTTTLGSNVQTEKMRILDNGKIGIGTTTPQAKVEIVTDNNSEFLRINKGSGNFQIMYGDNLGGVSNAAGVVYFECGGDETYVMGGHTVPDGNVGRDLGSYPSHIWQNLYVNDIWFNYAGDWMSNILYSDRRFKKNIEPINNALSDVMKLQAIKYDWRKDEFPNNHFDNKRHIGFIAQDIEKIYPEIVNTNDEGYKSLDYSKLTPVLVKAVQELKLEIDKLKRENEELRKLIVK